MDDKYKYKFSNYNPSTITFYNQERDELLKEPSLLAVDTKTDSLLAIGEEAQKLPELTKFLAVGSPLRHGIVADYELARSMFQFFLKKVNRPGLFFRPNIAVCVPIDMTRVEHEALNQVILCIGAKSVLIMEESFEKAIQNIPNSYKIIIEISSDIDSHYKH